MPNFNKNFLFFRSMRESIFKNERSRARRGKVGGIVGPIIFLIVAGLAIALFYFASLSKGSREEFEGAQALQPNPALAEKSLAESRSLESQFNSIHEFKKDQISDEDIDIFEKAVDAHARHLAYTGAAATYNPKHEQMRKRLHDLRADSLRKRTSALERQAEDLAQQKKYAEAERLFSDAATLEFRITKEYPLATKKNHARATFLENRARTMRAIPLQLRAQELEKSGEAALDAANWPKANLDLNEALTIEKQLWADYRNVIVSNSSRIHRLQNLIATVNSAPDYERRERFIAEARAAETRNDWQTAAEQWSQALAVQRSIKQNFPRSLYAVPAIEKEIAQKYADAGARPEYLKLLEECEIMRKDIRSRQTNRVPLIAKQALRRAENILRDWQDSTLISENFLQELRYMDVKATDIPGVQNNLFKLLLPIPGVPETTKMLRVEVSQALYTFVMPFNPSARKALENPVESVDYNDAREFCRRLSLLLGRPVRLPTLREFLAAAGTPDPQTIHESAWLIENSSGVVHASGSLKANASGFFDLYGNVAEWIDTEPADGIAKKDYEECIAGGDCQTPAYAFPAEIFKKTARSEKSRLRGFRFVVEEMNE